MCVLRTAYTGQLFMLPLPIDVNMFVLEKERDWTLVNDLPMELLLRFFSLVLLLLAWQCQHSLTHLPAAWTPLSVSGWAQTGFDAAAISVHRRVQKTN